MSTSTIDPWAITATRSPWAALIAVRTEAHSPRLKPAGTWVSGRVAPTV
jgi:hypothetical protein